jgi:hypothetical protein
MSSSKKLTCKRTLRQMFIRVYRLKIQSVMLVFFDPALWTGAPLTFPLVQFHPPPFPAWISIRFNYTRVQCVGWGMGSKEGRGPQTDKHLPQSSFNVVFFYMKTLNCLLQYKAVRILIISNEKILKNWKVEAQRGATLACWWGGGGDPIRTTGEKA